MAAAIAWRVGALTGAGAIAASLVGTAILVGTGWSGGAALAAFFVSSTVVGRLWPPRSRLDPKGERRDAWQVVANGGPAALGALLGLAAPGLGLWLVTGSLAAAAADTWATSLGGVSRASPRRLLLGEPVDAGASGGMTAIGSLAAAGGAGLVAGTAVAAGADRVLLPLGIGIGFAGMLADSVLGAFWQGRFRCPACDLVSEWPVHRCGTRTTREGGLEWLTNDGVNLAATAFAAGLAAAAWLLWSG